LPQSELMDCKSCWSRRAVQCKCLYCGHHRKT